MLKWTVVAALCFHTTVAHGIADLAIGDDEVYRRPNSWSDLSSPLDSQYAYAASRTGVSIAWRNADQVEEVEVRVVNFGDQRASGRLSVDIVDADALVLLHLSPPDGEEVIQVPEASMGGREGKVIRMKASWELNGLIDRFDLGHVQYGVMATIEPLGPDADLSNNRKTKTWNNMSRITLGGTSVFNYSFVNAEETPRTFSYRLERNNLPPGWELQDTTSGERTSITLKPRERVSGTVTLRVPEETSVGAFSEARISLVNPDGSVYRQHEWFEIYDRVPPNISNYRAVLLRDHTVAIQALVADEHSGVLEATGVSTQFSVDKGKTWATKAHNYKTGNFIRPTLFETVLGPFAPGTTVMLRFTAKDTAGNVAAIIPVDARAFVAPSGAEQLVQMAYIFPRTQPNAVFEVEALRALAASVKAAQTGGQDVRTWSQKDLEQLGIPQGRLAELGVDSARFEDLKSDLHRLGLLSLGFDQIQPVELRSVTAPGEEILELNTLEVTVP